MVFICSKIHGFMKLSLVQGQSDFIITEDLLF